MKSEKVRVATYRDLICVEIRESGETMVNASDALADCVCISTHEENKPYIGNDIWAKEHVVKMLGEANDILKKAHPEYALKIMYGYRHPAVQIKWFEEIKMGLKTNNPTISETELNEMAHAVVAFPDVAGHPTGGTAKKQGASPHYYDKCGIRSILWGVVALFLWRQRVGLVLRKTICYIQPNKVSSSLIKKVNFFKT